MVPLPNRGFSQGYFDQCLLFHQDISYTQYYDWFRKHQKSVVKVEVEGLPFDDSIFFGSHTSPAFSGFPSSTALLLKVVYWLVPDSLCSSCTPR